MIETKTNMIEAKYLSEIKLIKAKCLSEAEIIELIKSNIGSSKIGSGKIGSGKIGLGKLIDCPVDNPLFQIVDETCLR